MDIRPILKENLVFHYQKTFNSLENILNHLGELSFYLSMNSSSISLSSSKVGRIDINRQLEYNAWILNQEIFDDFGAALSCFHIGYFKQCQSLLRGAIELTIQLWKSKLVEVPGNNIIDPWIDGMTISLSVTHLFR
ncbi:hypothetical protein DQQ10_27375 [Pseudochryseolinea flava]|uniref:Uncharacterized protein n=1 Tax=Pseudochryseolinea flava TaxID=2059302 RepID=A0A364XTN4_9BACT|nr:hypothetical protein DQQ10_27375 [Pseudochryseolinea flava]